MVSTTAMAFAQEMGGIGNGVGVFGVLKREVKRPHTRLHLALLSLPGCWDTQQLVDYGMFASCVVEQ